MSNSPSNRTVLMAYTRFSLDRSTPSLWRVTFDNPPINLIDPVMAVELDALLTEIEQDDRLAVVVFDSADRDYFLAHFDITADRAPFDALPAARTPFHHWANVLIRLSRSRAVTISALRGRARGAGSELGRDNIRVNSVHPGPVRTPMTAGPDAAAAVAAEARRLAIPRVAEPDEITRLVLFVASDEASFSTGSEFIVDGGVLLGPAPQYERAEVAAA